MRYDGVPWPTLLPFIPIVATIWISAELFTAILLYTQFVVTGLVPFAVFGAAFGLTGLLTIPYLLLYPRVFSGSGAALGSDQISAWLWITWHVAFALVAITYRIVDRDVSFHLPDAAAVGRVLRWSVTLVLALACLVVGLAVAGHDALPILVADGRFTGLYSNMSFFAAALCGLAALGMLVLSRRQTLLELWLGVALLSESLDALGNALATDRYSVGWYIGKLEATVTAGIVLVVLIFGIASLYRRLGAQHGALGAALESAREAAQLTAAQRETLRKALDVAHESARHRAEFVATLSHEIRTPMNGVIGMAQLLLATNLTAHQVEYANAVRSSGTALLRVINDLSDYSKLESGRFELERADFEISSTIDTVATLFAAEARSKGIALRCHVDAKLPPVLRGDEVRFRQVLMNLVDNAIKFTQEGSVVLEAVCEADDARAVRLRITVKDSGIGIPALLQDVLFEPFRQADSTTTRRYGGTGLGLALSRSYVELMGGEIGVTSAPGTGATFWISLTLERGIDFATALETHMLRGARVLVVDDNINDREVLFRHLQVWGMHCDTADGAASALEKVVRAGELGQPYALAIAAYHLSQLDGIALARVLRRTPGAGALPVVLMSADHMLEALVHQSGLHNATTLAKPVRQLPLFNALLAVLAKRDDVATPPRALPAAELASERRAKILLVEDNVINQLLALRQLSKLGYLAEPVLNGREALAAIENGSFDLVLMDCHMPVMDGYEATALIRKHERATLEHIPIVAMTANARDEDRDRCLAGGMDDYLSKPVVLEDLQRVLDRWAAPNAAL